MGDCEQLAKDITNWLTGELMNESNLTPIYGKLHQIIRRNLGKKEKNPDLDEDRKAIMYLTSKEFLEIKAKLKEIKEKGKSKKRHDILGLYMAGRMMGLEKEQVLNILSGELRTFKKDLEKEKDNIPNEKQFSEFITSVDKAGLDKNTIDTIIEKMRRELGEVKDEKQNFESTLYEKTGTDA